MLSTFESNLPKQSFWDLIFGYVQEGIKCPEPDSEHVNITYDSNQVEFRQLNSERLLRVAALNHAGDPSDKIQHSLSLNHFLKWPQVGARSMVLPSTVVLAHTEGFLHIQKLT